MLESVPATVLEAIAAVPLFSACNKAELRAISRLGTQVEAADGAVLTKQGDPGAEFCLILEGGARCSIDGREVGLLATGDFFGEMALLDHGPRRATVVAAGPVRLLVLDAREFSGLLDTSTSICKKLLAALAARTRRQPSLAD